MEVWLIQKIGRRPAFILLSLLWSMALCSAVAFVIGGMIVLFVILLKLFGFIGAFIIIGVLTIAIIFYQLHQLEYPEQKAKDE